MHGQSSPIIVSPDLEIIPLTENTFIHKSFTDSDQFGRFSSNGIIYIRNGEALIADTPVDTLIAKQLINWVLDQNLKIEAVVVNHHHKDALGSLSVFHDLDIPSYGFIKTKELALKSKSIPPEYSFEDSLKLKLGTTIVKAFFFGEGHTIDNIALWIPEEKILFGGCLIKSLRSGKGNLEDANIKEWSQTILTIKTLLPDINTVVPGHGSHGGVELLDFTQKMFEN